MVPEVIAAHDQGIRVLVLSLVANKIVTGEGQETLSVFMRRLSRVEVNQIQDSKMLELHIVLKLKKQLDCPQRRRRLNLGSPRPKLRLLNTGNPTTTECPQYESTI